VRYLIKSSPWGTTIHRTGTNVEKRYIAVMILNVKTAVLRGVKKEGLNFMLIT